MSQHTDAETTDWAFGPGSISWRVMSDPAVFIIGLLREAMLLTLHPAFAAAAVDHDSFGDDPVMRFRRIGVYTYGATYGSKADAERVSAMVRRRHSTIFGTEPLTGEAYRAHSEYELALTQAMLSASFLAVFEELNGPLPGRARDQFLLEQKVPAALLGVHPDHLPETYGQLVDFLAHARQRFTTGLQGREILAPFIRTDYPRGTAIGELPPARRRAAMFGIRAAADMAIITMNEEERQLVSVGRRPKLGSDHASRLALRALSAYLRSPRGRAAFDRFLGANTAKIVNRGLAANAGPGRRTRASTFRVPSATDFLVTPPDLQRNWPGAPGEYRLGPSAAAPPPDGARSAPARNLAAS